MIARLGAPFQHAERFAGIQRGFGHGSVNLFAEDGTLLDAEAGITVLDDAESMTFPTTRQAYGKDGVLVGRIRTDLGAPNGLACWVVADNLRYFAGAARNVEGKAAGEYSPDHLSYLRRDPMGVIAAISRVLADERISVEAMLQRGRSASGVVPVVLIVSKNVRANNLRELIAELRENPGKYTFGGGVGSPSHVMGSWMNRLKGLNVTHIPYRGGAQAVSDVVGGHIDMFYAGVAPAKAAVESGSVKAMAVTGDARSMALPNVPTFAEAGVPEFDLGSWNVFMAPKGTPAPVVGLLKKETAAALNDPAVRTHLASQGVEPSQTQDVRKFLDGERQKFGRAVRDLNLTLPE